MRQNISKLVTSMLEGDSMALARLITSVERESRYTPEILDMIPLRPRKAYCIGITGAAGTGKRTLIKKLTTIIRSKGISIGIIAVDPSSAITGGAVLGDRIRMQQHWLDDGIFIRSMATRGKCGGLSKAIKATVKLLDASGKDIIIIETTGVGQTEVGIAEVADSVAVVMVSGLGDSIQLMKAGFIEIADVIVINKTDQPGAENLASEIREVLMLAPDKAQPPIVMTQATDGSGIEDLYQQLDKCRSVSKS